MLNTHTRNDEMYKTETSDYFNSLLKFLTENKISDPKINELLPVIAVSPDKYLQEIVDQRINENISRNLLSPNPFRHVLPTEDFDGDYPIAVCENNVVYAIDLDKPCHTLCLGMTNSGKTSLVKSIIRRLLEDQL